MWLGQWTCLNGYRLKSIRQHEKKTGHRENRTRERKRQETVLVPQNIWHNVYPAINRVNCSRRNGLQCLEVLPIKGTRVNRNIAPSEKRNKTSAIATVYSPKYTWTVAPQGRTQLPPRSAPVHNSVHKCTLLHETSGWPDGDQTLRVDCSMIV